MLPRVHPMTAAREAINSAAGQALRWAGYPGPLSKGATYWWRRLFAEGTLTSRLVKRVPFTPSCRHRAAWSGVKWILYWAVGPLFWWSAVQSFWLPDTIKDCPLPVRANVDAEVMLRRVRSFVAGYADMHTQFRAQSDFRRDCLDVQFNSTTTAPTVAPFSGSSSLPSNRFHPYGVTACCWDALVDIHSAVGPEKLFDHPDFKAVVLEMERGTHDCGRDLQTAYDAVAKNGSDVGRSAFVRWALAMRVKQALVYYDQDDLGQYASNLMDQMRELVKRSTKYDLAKHESTDYASSVLKFLVESYSYGSSTVYVDESSKLVESFKVIAAAQFGEKDLSKVTVTLLPVIGSDGDPIKDANGKPRQIILDHLGIPRAIAAQACCESRCHLHVLFLGTHTPPDSRLGFLKTQLLINAHCTNDVVDDHIIEHSDGEVKGHSGFLRCWRSIAPQLQRTVDAAGCREKEWRAHFYGHSLGGALAQIAGCWYSMPFDCPKAQEDKPCPNGGRHWRRATVHTASAPPVFNTRGVAILSKRAQLSHNRFVHARDFAPWLQDHDKASGFGTLRHFGNPILLSDRSGPLVYPFRYAYTLGFHTAEAQRQGLKECIVPLRYDGYAQRPLSHCTPVGDQTYAEYCCSRLQRDATTTWSLISESVMEMKHRLTAN